MNDDHLDDVVRVGNKGIYIDYQQPEGSYRQRFFPLAVLAVPDWSIAAGDLDNDGYNDLLFANTNAVSFVFSRDHGSSFEEGLMPVSLLSQRSTMADIDQDGWLDAFVCNDTAQSMPFHNLGAGEMVPDTSLIRTSQSPGSYSAIWTDYDLDADIDLYISKCQVGALPSNPNRTNLLYRNDGFGLFTEVGHEAGVDDNAQSWSTVFEDFDNDGDFDAFVVNHDFQNRLYRNEGDGTFTDVIASSGINALDLQAFENASGDFNNDGYMDIFAQLEHELYLGHGDMTFTGQDAPVALGAIGDLNHDGFLDVFHNNKSWINTGNTNHYLKIIPLGLESNRNGIGTRIDLYGAWGRQTREVRSGQSYSPMSSLTVHFGLGAYEQVDSMVLHWPSGVVTHRYDLKADTLYFVPEASCLLPEAVIASPDTIALCPGDSVTLSAPGGFAHYTWSNGAEGNSLTLHAEGRYYARCVDTAGCTAVTNAITVIWKKDTVPSIFAPSGNTLCAGDSLLLMALPAKPYTWSDGQSGVASILVRESGIYTVSGYAACTEGLLTSRPFHVEVLHAPPPVAMDAELLPGDSILLTATGDNCAWYDQPVGGNLLATGDTYQTSPLFSSRTFYVESHPVYPGEMQSGGKPDTTGSGGVALQPGYLTFDAWEPFTLVSVTVFVPDSGVSATRFVQLWSGDSVIAFKSFVIGPGTHVLELNFDVPAGKHSLWCQQGLMWRNTGTLDYPYPIGEVGQITSSSFGEAYYYFFYDWKIRKPDHACISARTPVSVIITAAEVPQKEPLVAVYPNPARESISIHSASGHHPCLSYQLFDTVGHEVIRGPGYTGEEMVLDISMLAPGVYALFLRGDRWQQVNRIMKN